MQDRTPRLPLLNQRTNKKSKGVQSLPRAESQSTPLALTTQAPTSVSAFDHPTDSTSQTTHETQLQATDLRLSGSGVFPFPIVGDRTYNRPWRPYLVGEGEFQEASEHDAITQAQAALAALEEGTLRLVKLVESDNSQWDRPRAA